ncbi:MAG: hypothetical protein OHK0021_18950 [Bryobacter sp.]
MAPQESKRWQEGAKAGLSLRGLRAVGQRVFGTFALGPLEVAVAMEQLEEVIPAPEAYAPLPLAPVCVRGLIALRGEVLPVVDTRRLLGVGVQERVEKGRIAIVGVGNAHLGFLFDSTGEVLRLEASDIQTAGWAANNGSSAVFSGMILREEGQRLIQVLACEQLLSQAGLAMMDLGQQDRFQENRRKKVQRLTEHRLVMFSLGGQGFAIDGEWVARVVEPGQNGIPALQAAARRDGVSTQVVILGREAVPVIRLASVIDLLGAEEEDNSRQVLICRTPAGGKVGLAIARTEALKPYQKEDVKPIALLSGPQSGYFEGCLLREGLAPRMVFSGANLLGSAVVMRVVNSHQQLQDKQTKQQEAAEVETERRQKVALVSFRIGRQFGIRVEEIREIVSTEQEWVFVPQAPPAMVGTIGLRGMPIPVIDPRILFELGGTTPREGGRILIFEAEREAAETSRVGLLVDRVDSILRCEVESEDLPNIFFTAAQERFGHGFERAIGLTGEDGTKQPLILLRTASIVERLLGVVQRVSADTEVGRTAKQPESKVA